MFHSEFKSPKIIAFGAKQASDHINVIMLGFKIGFKKPLLIISKNNIATRYYISQVIILTTWFLQKA